MPDLAQPALAIVVCLWLLYGLVRLSRWVGRRRDAREAAAWLTAHTDAQPAETWQHDFIH